MSDETYTKEEADERFITHPEATRAHRVLALGLGIVLFVIGIGTAIGFKLYDDNADDLRSANVASCNRGNDVRAYLIIDAGQNARQPAQRQQRAKDLFPLQDCEAVARDGKPVPLPPDQQNLVIARVAQRMGVAAWNVNASP